MSDSEVRMSDVNLATLMGIEANQIEGRVFGENLPKITGEFECVSSEMKTVNEGTPNQFFLFQSDWEVKEVVAAIDKDVDPEKIIGRKHQQIQPIKDMSGLEFTKGFLELCGVEEKGTLQDMIKSLEGVRVRANIQHRQDKNDADIVYSSLAKVKPVVL